MQIPVYTQIHIQQNKQNLPKQKVQCLEYVNIQLCTLFYKKDMANKIVTKFIQK